MAVRFLQEVEWKEHQVSDAKERLSVDATEHRHWGTAGSASPVVPLLSLFRGG